MNKIETYTIPDAIKVFGLQVKNFPDGIGEVFHQLVNLLPAGDTRPFYGISQMTDKGFSYVAAALEMKDGEAESYACEAYTVPKGDYLSVRVEDWPEKTKTINSIFGEMFKDARAQMGEPCIEIYKDRKEMFCLVRMKKV
jgi:hypothetical protein